MLYKRKRFRAYLLHLIERQLYFNKLSLKTGRTADNIAALQAYPLYITNTLHLGLYLHLLPQSYKPLSDKTFHDFISTAKSKGYINDIEQLQIRLLK